MTDTVFACDALGDLYRYNEQLLWANKELLARCDLLEAELAALVEAVGKVVEMHRKGEGHVCTHYPSGRVALDALTALVGEE